jgi:hypothetical protein
LPEISATDLRYLGVKRVKIVKNEGYLRAGDPADSPAPPPCPPKTSFYITGSSIAQK